MPACRYECPPLTLGPLKSARGSSFWPTPTASSYGSSNNGCPGDGREEYATRGKPSLEAMARSTWPTPMASDGERLSETFARGNETLVGAAKRSQWPTPVASDHKSGHYGGNDRARPLREVVLWPTATARDHRRSGSRNKPGSLARPGLSLTDATLRGGSSRQGQPASTRGMVLNPRFVERLMGFPDGWVVPSSKHWGTQLSLLLPPVPG